MSESNTPPTPKPISLFDFQDETATIFTLQEKEKQVLKEQWEIEQEERQALFELQTERNYQLAMAALLDAMNNAIDSDGMIDYATRVRAASHLINLRTKTYDKTYAKKVRKNKETRIHDGFKFSF